MAIDYYELYQYLNYQYRNQEIDNLQPIYHEWCKKQPDLISQFNEFKMHLEEETKAFFRTDKPVDTEIKLFDNPFSKDISKFDDSIYWTAFMMSPEWEEFRTLRDEITNTQNHLRKFLDDYGMNKASYEKDIPNWKFLIDGSEIRNKQNRYKPWNEQERNRVLENMSAITNLVFAAQQYWSSKR